MTLAQLKTQVLSKLEPMTSAPAYNAIHDDQWQRWADEKIMVIVGMLFNAKKIGSLQLLIVPDTSVGLTAGVGVLPQDFFKALSLTTGNTRTQATLYENPDDFLLWDSASFLTTPSAQFPVGTIMNQGVYVKPIATTTCYLTYIKNHPALTGAQATLFDKEGDEPLVEEVYQTALKSLEVMEG